jgi:hypothetical protein
MRFNLLFAVTAVELRFDEEDKYVCRLLTSHERRVAARISDREEE